MSKLSRRTFFQGAAVAASATRVLGANDRVSIGIVGVGGRGRAHIGRWNTIAGASVGGLCDVNQASRERGQAILSKAGQPKAEEFRDMRDMYASKAVDAVAITTPNHWHSLATIWACQAGKDVFCEKPACHNPYEGQKMIEVARSTERIVQIGSQSRSTAYKIRAMELLRDGVIGKLYMAKGLCFKRRKSIGHTPAEPVPPGIDWDLFLGPAQMKPFSQNQYAYNWHWFWDTGNGDIGNQGVHEMDLARWGLGELTMPKWVFSNGGKYIYDDDQETPNTQFVTLDYGDMQIQFEVRGLLTGPEGGEPVSPGNDVGDLFFGADGWMHLDGRGFKIYKGERDELVMEEKGSGDGTKEHMENFLAAVHSRDHTDLTADVEVGVISANLCHLANISYRVGRRLVLDSNRSSFVNDWEANKLLTRDYREPYVV